MENNYNQEKNGWPTKDWHAKWLNLYILAA